MENIRLKNEEEERQWKEALVKLYLNLCLCNLRQKKSKPVITYCRKALELDPKNIKAHFRLGQVWQLFDVIVFLTENGRASINHDVGCLSLNTGIFFQKCVQVE